MTTDHKKNHRNEIRETILLLNVAVARIEHAMIDGHDSVTTLSKTFVDMADAARQISRDVEELAPGPEREKIEQHCQTMSEKIQTTVTAFQFYDRLSQRMAHVSKTLSDLGALLDSKEKAADPAEWQVLQQRIRSRYTLDADQQMFDNVLNGMTVEEALDIALNRENKDEIEFF